MRQLLQRSAATIEKEHHEGSAEPSAAKLLRLDQPGCRHAAKIAPVTAFVEGQYVELNPTIRSRFGGSVESGTRGIVREIDLTRPDEDVYRVALLRNERLTGEEAWLREVDLLAA